MAKYEFDKNKFEEWKRAQKESYEIQNKLNSSVKEYAKALMDLGQLQKNIVSTEKELSKLKKDQALLEDKKKKNEIEIAKLRRSGVALSSDEVNNLIKQNREYNKLIAAKKQSIGIVEAELKYTKEQTAELQKQVGSVNKLNMGFKAIGGSLSLMPGLIKKGFGMLKGTGIFEMDKEIRNAVRSMAGGQNTYNNMYNTITKAAESTTMWGVGVKDLAIMQRGYSEAIGKSVMLTQDGYKAMAKLAEGTGLGTEFAVEMASSMDKFNISAERTSNIVRDVMNISAKMGVNGAAAIKSMQSSLKLAQRFTFKGGIRGLAMLATEAARLKLDMEGIAGMAEKVFRPEGAIEMAAQLTTMGGSFAALGDPMQLMFKARNDMAGFSKDIGRATAEFVEFNKENGEFQIKNGLAADRMREIANITGISVEKLQEMASAEAKIQEIRKNTGGRFSKEDSDTIATMSKFEKGNWVINVNGQDKLVKNLRATDLANIRAEKKNLDERAEEARTFDEVLADLILQFKQLLLPFAKDLKLYLGGPIQQLSKEWTAKGFYESLRGFVQSAVDLIPAMMNLAKVVTQWITDNPIKSAFVAGGVLFGGVIGKLAMWVANGIALGKGFLLSTRGFGGGGGIGGGGAAGASRLFNTRATGAGSAMGRLGLSRGAQMGMNFRGAARSGGAIGGGLLSAGISGYSEFSENSAMGMGTGENIGRTVSRGAGAGLGAWGGAAAGAAIGSVVPVVGTIIGGIIGGLAGGALGDYVGEGVGDAIYGNEGGRNSSAQSRPTRTRGGRIPTLQDGIMFHPNDKFKQISIAGTSTSGNNKLAQELSGNNKNKVQHEFGEMKVNVSVTAPSNDDFWFTLFNDPRFMRELTTRIHKASEENSSGGKITGSGPKQKRTR